jgi:hypothetical protein
MTVSIWKEYLTANMQLIQIHASVFMVTYCISVEQLLLGNPRQEKCDYLQLKQITLQHLKLQKKSLQRFFWKKWGFKCNFLSTLSVAMLELSFCQTIIATPRELDTQQHFV